LISAIIKKRNEKSEFSLVEELKTSFYSN